MELRRIPVMIFDDASGHFVAWPVGVCDDRIFGYGTTARTAREDLEACLHWLAKRHRSVDFADELKSPQLLRVSVPTQPVLRNGSRLHPAGELVSIPAVGTAAYTSDGYWYCEFPQYRVNFNCEEEKQLRSLAERHLRYAMEKLGPEELRQALPPKQVILESVMLRAPKAGSVRAAGEAPEELTDVAEPLGHASMRRQFFRPWERDATVRDLAERLRLRNVNVLLVGETGCGKTAVLIEAVRTIEAELKKSGELPYSHLYWMTSGQRLIAGMRFLGQWEERCEEIIEAVAQIGGVLCIDSLLALVELGGAGPVDSAAAFLLPYLERGELRIVAECTPGELDACRRLLPGLADVFQIVPVPQFTTAQAQTALALLAGHLAAKHKVQTAQGTVPLICQLFSRFMPYHPFPGKAALFAAKLYDKTARQKLARVEPAHVIAEFTNQTGLPEQLLRDDITLSASGVRDRFAARVIGQSAGVAAATSVALTCKAAMNDPRRPIRVMLFCGPTGVGKTELAKALADYFFGQGEQKERLVRLDMSEYSGSDAAHRLLYGPDGRCSPFIQRLRQQPFCVLLLDEIEKAAPAIFDVLLGAFDEGRLTDPYGRTTMLRSAVIVMTSNVGARAKGSLGFQGGSQPDYSAELKRVFRPEFINRIDDIVQFEALGEETILAVARKELDELARREGLMRGGVTLEWTGEVLQLLAREGFDPQFGARPLQRTLEARLIVPLARFLLGKSGKTRRKLRATLAPSGQIEFEWVQQETRGESAGKR